MATTNKETLVEKLTAIADGFRESREITDQLSLDEMATLGAEPSMETQEKTVDYTSNGTYELYPDEGYALSKVTANVNVRNILPQVVDKTVTDVYERDLAGATKIGDYMFRDCINLESVTLPFYGVTEIGRSAFDGCSNLITIAIPDSVTSIGKYAFYDCESLTSITIPDGVTSIGDQTFYECRSLPSVTIPNSVTSIGGSAFAYCTSLTSITIPDSVTSIGTNTFEVCISLMSATIGNGITTISSGAFGNCRGLTTVAIPDSVTELGGSVFSGCDNLTSLTIPTGVTKIGFWALHTGTTTNKTYFNFLPTTPPTITSSTFEATKINKIRVPVGCEQAYKTATNWANFADYISEEDG